MRRRCADEEARVRTRQIVSLIVLALAGCATAHDEGVEAVDLAPIIQSSCRARGQAGLDRLEQTEMQRACSRAQPDLLPADLKRHLEREALESVRYPDDEHWLGDWKRGEQIAQSGVGLNSATSPRRRAAATAMPATSCPEPKSHSARSARRCTAIGSATIRASIRCGEPGAASGMPRRSMPVPGCRALAMPAS